MIKRFGRGVLTAIGVGALALFIWKGWGEAGNMAGFFMMLWDWFYAVCDAIVVATRHAIGMGN